MKTGWISLHRKIQDHWLWKEKRIFSKAEAWIDILMECNHEGQKVNLGNEVIYCQRAESVKSLKTWASRWGWTISRVRRFLELLKSDSMIELKPTHNTTHLKVLNYDSYQDTRNESETNLKQKRNESETKVATNNNDNNDNNDNNERGAQISPAPVLDTEIQIIWIRSFKRNPSFVETEETEKLIEKFGMDKVKNIFREAGMKGFKNLGTLISSLDENGNIKPFEKGKYNATNFSNGRTTGNPKSFDDDPISYDYIDAGSGEIIHVGN